MNDPLLEPDGGGDLDAFWPIPTSSPSLYTPPGAGAAGGLRWVWEAMEPADRRAALRRLHSWVTWITQRHREPPVDIGERIPGCWYLHPGPLDRLTGIYLEWLRVYDADSDLPIPSFFDALDRHTATLGFAGKCLRHRHHELPGAGTVPDWDTWITTSQFAAAPATTPDFAPATTAESRPHMNASWLEAADGKDMVIAADQMERHIATGEATKLGGTPAVHYDGDWWFGDDETFVRVPDPEVKADMDRKARSLHAAEKALTESRDEQDGEQS